MEKIGQTLKILRTSRNLSQREVARGAMDFSYYNRVENDKVNVSFTKLVKILENLDISMDEFIYLYESTQDGKEDLFHSISVTSYQNNIKELERIKKHCKNLFNQTEKYSYRHAYIFCDFVLRRKKNQELPEKYINEITEYLNSLSYYLADDVRILANFYDILPYEMVVFLFKKIFIEKKKYSKFKISEQNRMLFCFNVIDLAFRHENYNFAKKVLQLTNDEFVNPLNLLSITICNYYDGLFIILFSENFEQGIKMAEETIQVLTMCNLKHHAERHKEYLEEIKNKRLM